MRTPSPGPGHLSTARGRDTRGPAARRAVVVGGGLGGLAAAIALHRTGWHVDVLERAPEFGEVGAGITLMPNGLAALDELGLGVAIRAGGRWQGQAGLRDDRGRWLSRVDRAEEVAGGALGIHRAALHELLRGALPGDSLHAGAAVDAVRPDGTVRVGRSEWTADLVVGSDGVHSGTRTLVVPDARPPRALGTRAWRAVVDRPVPALGIGWGPGLEFGIVPLVDGRTYWFAAESNDATVPSGRSGVDHLLRTFGSWYDPVPAIIAATDPSSVLVHDVPHLPHLRTFVNGRVALLGDAAHAMAPTLGQGACQAFEDAVTLAAAVRDVPVAEGLGRYDAARRPRTRAVSEMSLRLDRAGHRLRNPAGIAVRNLLIASTPSRVAVAQMPRAVAWTPPSLGAEAPAR